MTPAPDSERFALAAAALLLALLLVTTLAPAQWASLPDFDKAYYPAGRKALVAPGTLYAAEVVDFVNVPIVALLFMPFALLDESSARLAFSLTGVAAVTLTVVWLARACGLTPWARAGVLALVVLSGPLHYSFALGNASHLLLPLLLAVFAADRAGRDATAGALLALAAVVKIPLLVLPLHFLLGRRWRALAAFGVTLAGVATLSLALFGLELHRTWFLRCIQPFAQGPLAAYNVQSVDGLLARLMTEAGRQDWSPVAVGPAFLALRSALIALLLGAVVAACWPRGGVARGGASTLGLSIVLTLALLVSPISWTHYYVFLSLPLAFLIGGWIRAPRFRGWLALVAAGALLLSLPVLAAPGRGGSVLRWLYRATAHSPHFVGGLLLLAALIVARRAGPEDRVRPASS